MTRLIAPLLVSVCSVAPVFAQSAAPADAPAASAAPLAAAKPAEKPPVPSVGSLFRDLGTDFKRLPSLETAAILGVGGVASLVARPNDPAITRSASGSEGLDRFFEPGAVLGSTLIQGGGALATYVVGHVKRAPKVALVGSDLIRGQLVNGVLTTSLKVAVDRDRPNGGHYSFPSGHTSSTAATAAVLQRHFGWKAGVPAYGVAAYVAGSRLQENVHFLSDVIFGAAIGIVSGRTVSFGHRGGTFMIAPYGGPRAAGVSLTLTPSTTR